MPELRNDVLSWATDLDENTRLQAERTARLAIVHKPLALMADAHLGLGATIGSVIATDSAIIPAAVGVDIGCGMIAQKTTLDANEIEPILLQLHDRIRAVVPAGQPRRGHTHAGSHHKPVRSAALKELLADVPTVHDSRFTTDKVAKQFGTLGGGNHFVEVTVDEQDIVWVVLHSGSRGPGNLIAQEYIGRAKKGMAKILADPLEDPDLSYFVEGTRAFERYVDAMHWAQRYAFSSRQAMMDAIITEVERLLPDGSTRTGTAINCHHNYANKERHFGRDLWITRKGAISAQRGAMGIIPGSMATGSYIVEGRGNPESYTSASHGAGRVMSRNRAKKELTEASLQARMDGIVWNDDARGLLDEHPEAYKDLDRVMTDQSDLVEVKHRLTTILNYKGT